MDCFSFCNVAPSNDSTSPNQSRGGGQALFLASTSAASKFAPSPLTDHEVETTQQELQRAFLDLNGISQIIEEDPTFVSACLDQLDVELAKLCQSSAASAYIQASQQSLEYVQSSSLRMAFLRANEFVGTKAANHMIRFFQMKKELFGTEWLTKRITFSDMEEGDKRMILSGTIMFSGTDRAGRGVFFGFTHLKPQGWKAINLCRCMFYVLLAMVEDNEEIQRRGIVGIKYMVGSRVIVADRDETQVQRVREVCPVRTVGAHLCFNDSIVGRVAPFYLTILGAFTRIRSRQHQGTNIECQYSLMSFGIPPECLPIDSTGVINFEGHHAWIQKRLALEEAWKMADPNRDEDEKMTMKMDNDSQPMTPHDSPISVGEGTDFHLLDAEELLTILDVPMEDFGTMVETEESTSKEHNGTTETQPVQLPIHRDEPVLLPPSYVPSPHTVLIGRGKTCANAPGSLRLQVLVKDRLEQYSAAKSREEKSAIISSIIDKVHEAGGTFIKQDSKKQWWEVQDSIARERVTSIFRNCLADEYKSSSKNRSKRRTCTGDGTAPKTVVQD